MPVWGQGLNNVEMDPAKEPHLLAFPTSSPHYLHLHITPLPSPPGRGGIASNVPTQLMGCSRPHRAGTIRPHDRAPTPCSRITDQRAENSPSPERERAGVRADVPPKLNLKPV